MLEKKKRAENSFLNIVVWRGDAIVWEIYANLPWTYTNACFYTYYAHKSYAGVSRSRFRAENYVVKNKFRLLFG